MTGASVGIGRLVASSDPDTVVPALGLGSRIAPVLADPRAHRPGARDAARLDRRAGREPAGQVRDSAGGGVLRLGERNTETVEAAPRRSGLRLRARDVAGALGRTPQVEVASGAVTVRRVGGAATAL